MANVVLGVSGSVAAYRACDLARELMRLGHEVRVCLTKGGREFVTEALFEALTGQPCVSSAFDEPNRGKMAHIEWARWADLLVIAPASASNLCKIAQGVADDMLSTIALAYDGPIVVAPAMNPTMYGSAAVQAALDLLRARASFVVEPLEGEVACGETGQGKLASIEAIVSACESVLSLSSRLAGQTVLITSGPTREPIDDVRFLSNRSSGKMGAALARAALLMGAKVSVISGPAKAPLPLGAEVVRVTTALEMLEAAKRQIGEVDWVIGAAAVADYRPADRAEGKLRRTEGAMQIELIPNPDIIAELATLAKPNTKVVGFAAEPTADLETAERKLSSKNLHAIAVNDISRADAGFDSDTNELTLVWPDGTHRNSGPRSKLGAALWLFESLLDHPD